MTVCLTRAWVHGDSFFGPYAEAPNDAPAVGDARLPLPQETVSPDAEITVVALTGCSNEGRLADEHTEQNELIAGSGNRPQPAGEIADDRAFWLVALARHAADFLAQRCEVPR